jgi:nifR3 family TIM-barrel protein
MRIGSITVSTPFALAPMEEHTSLPLRRLMRRHRAGLMTGERLDAAAVAGRDRRALRLLATAPDERPCLAQISAADPATAAEAARVVEELGYAGLDLNADCPVARVLRQGAGGALMAEPSRLAALVAACRRAVNLPVTVKLRRGPDDGRETVVEAARLAADAGAAAVFVHARSVANGYTGPADWSAVVRVKAAVAVPVGGSGGIRTAADAVARLRESGADLVQIARGCLGNPWIFAQARALMEGREPVLPTPAERGQELLALAEAERAFYGPVLAQRRLSRLACYFVKDLPDFPAFRTAIQQVSTPAALRTLVRAHCG